MTYFVQKEGIYCHGVFWIGEDLDEGHNQLQSLCDKDFDDYHEWVLYEYDDTCEYIDTHHDPEHKEILRITKEV